jgi:hypothetical protein
VREQRAREQSHKRPAKCHAFGNKIDYSIRTVEYAADCASRSNLVGAVQKSSVCDICQRQSAAAASFAKIEGAGTLM